MHASVFLRRVCTAQLAPEHARLYAAAHVLPHTRFALQGSNATAILSLLLSMSALSHYIPSHSSKCPSPRPRPPPPALTTPLPRSDPHRHRRGLQRRVPVRPHPPPALLVLLALTLHRPAPHRWPALEQAPYVYGALRAGGRRDARWGMLLLFLPCRLASVVSVLLEAAYVVAYPRGLALVSLAPRPRPSTLSTLATRHTPHVVCGGACPVPSWVPGPAWGTWLGSWLWADANFPFFYCLRRGAVSWLRCYSRASARPLW